MLNLLALNPQKLLKLLVPAAAAASTVAVCVPTCHDRGESTSKWALSHKTCCWSGSSVCTRARLAARLLQLRISSSTNCCCCTLLRTGRCCCTCWCSSIAAACVAKRHHQRCVIAEYCSDSIVASCCKSCLCLFRDSKGAGQCSVQSTPCRRCARQWAAGGVLLLLLPGVASWPTLLLLLLRLLVVAVIGGWLWLWLAAASAVNVCCLRRVFTAAGGHCWCSLAKHQQDALFDGRVAEGLVRKIAGAFAAGATCFELQLRHNVKGHVICCRCSLSAVKPV